MRSILINVLTRLLAGLPLRINQQLGSMLGFLAWHLHTSLRSVTETNLALCFPDWDTEKRTRVAKQSLKETGKALTEAPWIWRRPAAQVLALVQESPSFKLLQKAREDEKGLLLATPHLGSWELCNLPLSTQAPLVFMYRSPRMLALENDIIRWRQKMGGTPARLDQQGIRLVLRTLRGGNTVGILPDQEPNAKGGVFASFFGVRANTMTLFAKLTAKGNANVLFCFAERLPKGAGWKMHYREACKDTMDADPEIAANALNQSIENCILKLPEQYLWNYKRFRQLEDGTRRDYKRASLSNQ